VFNGAAVPPELLSGHHKNIAAWRRRQSLLKTAMVRPDLLAEAILDKSDVKFLQERVLGIKGIVTVIGKDQVGIIAKVCTLLSDEGVNILDISQTIVQGYFNMMMVIDITGKRIEDLADSLKTLGEGIGVQIKLQHEDIFNAMHRV
jgi:ACT domain-containing protein